MLQSLLYRVRGQSLSGESFKMASDTVKEIEVSFAFEGDDWNNLDVIKAIFSNSRSGESYEKVLADSRCIIPHEVLTEKGTVQVNLVGSVITNGTVDTRITTYKTGCVDVLQKVRIDGQNTVTPTPSAFEQFVEAVKEDADRAEAARDEAEQFSESAEGSATTASEKAEEAGTSASAAEGSATEAEQAKAEAIAAQEAAETAQESAESSAESAGQSAESAQSAQTAAESARDSAISAKGSAISAKDDAQTAASSAISSAGTASAAASSASSSAQSASGSASAASASAESAQESAESAQESAESAQESKESAQGSAESAQESASDAQAAKSAAESAKTAAQSAQTAAETAQDLAEDAKDEAVEARDDIEDSIEGVAQEDTQLSIDEQVDRIKDLLEYIVEHGTSGSLNGFELNMDSETKSIIISYTDPDTGDVYEPAYLPTDSTGADIVDTLDDIAESLKIIAERSE